MPSSGVNQGVAKENSNSLGRRKLTEHLQGPRAALGAVGKEGIEKTKVACRRWASSLGGKTHQPTWNRWTTKMTLRKPGCKDRWWEGVILWAVLGRLFWGPQGDRERMLLDGGHTPCAQGTCQGPRAGASRGHRRQAHQQGPRGPGPQQARDSRDWMTTPVPTR